MRNLLIRIIETLGLGLEAPKVYGVSIEIPHPITYKIEEAQGR